MALPLGRRGPPALRDHPGRHALDLHLRRARAPDRQATLGRGGNVVEQTLFTWSGATLVEQTTTSPNSTTPAVTSWNYNGTHPVAQTETTPAAEASQQEIDRRFYSIVTDLVGTPTELVDEHGDIAWRRRTTLWGITRDEPGGHAGTPLRFPGQYEDPETGWHYNVHRYYDPLTARYASPDPLGLDPAPNHYAYVRNPLTWTDLLGLTPCSPGTVDDAMLALNRAEELQAVRNDYFLADIRGTTAVIGVFNTRTQQYTVRLGINGPGAMPASWTLRPGEEFVQAAGHAEEGIIRSLGPDEIPVFGAASRNFCNDICLELINTRDVQVGGAGIRGHAEQNSPYTLFWSIDD
ncbi:hypothetical protein E1265_17010 [Streptomyces sp. 8K308]|nr:hypothetical protein E1265_17010 [Streptomyces sp. 8K308]